MIYLTDIAVMLRKNNKHIHLCRKAILALFLRPAVLN
jgi:hypothetical protein